MRGLAYALAAWGLAGCGPTVEAPAQESSTADADPSASVTSSWSSTSTTATSSDATSSGTMSSTGSDSADAGDDLVEDGGFCHCSPDGGHATIECDPIAQDCPVGEKCMPWANDGGDFWNATKCSPIADMPAQPGEPCTAEGSGTSGIDDCEQPSMCWHVDPLTNAGVCVAMCVGGPMGVACADAQLECGMLIETVLPLCLSCCDPIAQDCGAGEACVPIGDDFLCVPETSGPMFGGPGSPCEHFDDCDAGSYCASPDAVVGCVGSVGCCASFCQLDAADPCPGFPAEVQCIPWWPDRVAPPGACYDATNLGACAVPG